MSITEILQQIHDKADHILGTECRSNLMEVVQNNASAIKRLVKEGLRPPTPLKVKKWIRTGELSKSNKTQAAIIEECGRCLDKNNTQDILGEVLFQATNGQYYIITVEALIQKANPEYVKDVLAEENY